MVTARVPAVKRPLRRCRLQPPDVSAELALNKDLIRRWIDFSNSGFAGSLDRFISTDYIGHLGAATIGRDELERLNASSVQRSQMRITRSRIWLPKTIASFFGRPLE
jgi:hypothetical protein